MMDALITCEDAPGKFCLSLKKSLWYGTQYLGNEHISRPLNNCLRLAAGIRVRVLLQPLLLSGCRA